MDHKLFRQTEINQTPTKIPRQNAIRVTNLLAPVRAIVFTRSSGQLDFMLCWILLTSLMYPNEEQKEVFE